MDTVREDYIILKQIQRPISSTSLDSSFSTGCVGAKKVSIGTCRCFLSLLDLAIVNVYILYNMMALEEYPKHKRRPELIDQ